VLKKGYKFFSSGPEKKSIKGVKIAMELSKVPR